MARSNSGYVPENQTMRGLTLRVGTICMPTISGVQMLHKTAVEITGGLSEPSKMPGRAWNIPASRCNMGSKLENAVGSVCSKGVCFAKGGRYLMPRTQLALERRYHAWLTEPLWVPAMITLVKRDKFFRWFDSGDLQSEKMLSDICEVARETPDTEHWLPTREYRILEDYHQPIPENLNIRVSYVMVDGAPNRWIKRLGEKYGGTSSVFRDRWPGGFICQSQLNGGHCGTCRECWSKGGHVSYPFHKVVHKTPCIKKEHDAYVSKRFPEKKGV